MGAELCEIVGLFLLDGLKTFSAYRECGLYSDGVITVLPNSSGFKVKKLKKNMDSSNPWGYEVPLNHHW